MVKSILINHGASFEKVEFLNKNKPKIIEKHL